MSARRGILGVTVATLTLVGSSVAQEPDGSAYRVPLPVLRLALVVGVENYDYLDRVPNALEDARTVHEALTGSGFTSIYLPDADTSQILDNVRNLAAQARRPASPGVIVFFFAGHGFQEAEFNYIVPREVSKEDRFDSSIAVKNVLSTLTASGPGISIVFLDACRTPTNVRSIDAPPGFATIDSTRNTLVSMAAGAGKPARSRARADATNSPYSFSLAQYLKRDDWSLSRVLNGVGFDVDALTGGEQTPQRVVDLNAEFFFRPAPERRDQERRDWQATLQTHLVKCVVRYTAAYPDSAYLDAALAWKASRGNDPTTFGGEACPEY